MSNVWEGRKTWWGTTDSQTETWFTAIVLSKAKNRSSATRQSAPLLQWLNSVTEDSVRKRVERTKDQAASSRMPPARSSLVSLESSVVVVGHRVTQDSLEYLVKGAQDPDISGIWTPRENVDSSLAIAYMRRQRDSRCETLTQIPGHTSRRFEWGCAARFWKPLPYFRSKYVIFAILFQT